METSTAASPEPVVLIIADISGYTRYMTANVKTFAHSQTIITELMKAIVREVDLPLEVAKLEGDAVFLFGRKNSISQSWAAQRQVIAQKMLAFFAVFREKVNELAYSTTCTCNACTHIENLRLKLVVHSGEALFHQVFNFQELAGVDVIIVHRLLKNSLRTSQYLLLTEAAQKDIALPGPMQLIPGVETYDDIGRINFGVYYPEPAHAPAGAQEAAPTTSFAARFGMTWKLFLNLWLKPLKALSARNQPQFQHLEAKPNRPAQIAFALLTILLTPIYVPVGTCRVLLRALQPSSSKPSQVVEAAHEHAPDGSCCKKT
jgi:hypothetical protein